MLLDRPVLALVKRLPFGLGKNTFTRYNFRGWELEDRYRSHHEMGDVWMHVTSVRNWLYIGDPDTVLEIWKRGKDFPREVSATGEYPDLTSMDDDFKDRSSRDQWRKHRRLVNNSFNDQNNIIVWSESVTVAADVLEYWTSKPSVETVADDARTLALHVMSRAGFGKSFKFRGREELALPSSDESVMSYKDSLKMILDNCVLIFVFGPKFLGKTWLPKKLQTLHKACNSFQRHMTEAYEQEKQAVDNGQSQAGDQIFLNLLVRASLTDDPQSQLSESEIYGNIFTFNFAGHDTTAHTFTFALYFLAAFPEVQDWIHEEICEVAGQRCPQEWEYELDFPRLKRCLAIMLETLRLYTPVPTSKFTDTGTQTLRVGAEGKKTIVLPPETMVIPSYAALQTDPKYWGNDSLEWRPSRWIKVEGDHVAQALGDEQLVTPRRGTYLAWSGGARDCPGRKFSQVEFVATMATLFREHRVDPVKMSGETADASRKRILHLIETDSAPVLLLQMLHPERAPLVWTRR
ncbi:hypothetical protein N0V82_005188 [Gnomoniopsis sp. IMI 355080]|nr:hypothetical protein N0V82_005188 [Gnomoniopsis sp. IMI 355080]